MNTQPILNIKPDLNELRNIEQITIDFIMAIINTDVPALEKLLHEEYTYLDNLNKWAALKWFQNQFSFAIPEQMMDYEIKEFVCVGCNCGNRSLMFHKGYFPVMKEHGNPPKTLTLTFEKGKLKDISVCYKYLSVEKTKERMEKN